MNHVPEEVGLLGLAVLGDAHVGQHLLDQQVARVLLALAPLRARLRAARADIVESHLRRVHRLRILEGGLEQLHHLHVVDVVHDVLKHRAIRLIALAQGAEDDHARHVLAHERHGGDDGASGGELVARAQQLHVERRRRPSPHLRRRPDLGHPRKLVGRLLVEDVDEIVGHLLLADEYLFRPVDDEVAARVQRALPKLGELLVTRVVEQAELGAEHHGHPPNVELGNGEVLHLLTALLVGAQLHGAVVHVDVERAGVGEVAQACLIGKERRIAPIRFSHRCA
mmetsp:Transcript_15513/g.41604  ORF Transcript_15513/g.41604 Transcript_15513/m.41604 type:complete len:282 (+) Transcript_15513:2568-3413(+)